VASAAVQQRQPGFKPGSVFFYDRLFPSIQASSHFVMTWDLSGLKPADYPSLVSA
jgi:hypothetical protein